jgi:type I restriction enzyme S subunit
MASGRFEHCLDDVLLSIQSGRSPGLPDVPAGHGEWGVLKVSAVQPWGLNHIENKAVRNRSLIDESIEVKQGDLLMTRANTDDLIGLSCIAKDPPPGLMLCDKTLRLDVNPELAIPEFVNLVLGLGEVRNQIRAMASGTSGSMKNVSQDSIRKLRIPLPSLDVQQRLLSAVGACESKISNARHRLDKLRLIKDGLTDDLLTGKVRVAT